jgi:hypothetical protein
MTVLFIVTAVRIDSSVELPSLTQTSVSFTAKENKFSVVVKKLGKCRSKSENRDFPAINYSDV